jgi:NAD(P)-dependent dehydrogenase (short-subunit alcohol dehydrogenase family)
MVKTFSLENKIILITGGYGHLGKAITESLLFHGANVYVLARYIYKFDKEFKVLREKYLDRLHFEKCDISDGNQIIKAFENINSKEGKIDILINNAFYSKGQSPEKMTDEEWAYGMEGTLNIVFRCIREIIPYFKSARRGKIINVSSMYGIVAPKFEIYDNHPDFLNPPHYGAAKAGVIQLSRYYASYLGHLNINVNTVTPGPFPSNNVQENAGFLDELKKRTCLKRIGYPEDLAGAFVFLSSDASDYITGQNIIIDGGWTVI